MSLINDVLQQLDQREMQDTAGVLRQVKPLRPVLTVGIPWPRLSLAALFIVGGFTLGKIEPSALRLMNFSDHKMQINPVAAAPELTVPDNNIRAVQLNSAVKSEQAVPATEVNNQSPTATVLDATPKKFSLLSDHYFVSKTNVANETTVVDNSAEVIQTSLREANELLAADKLMQPLGNNAFVRFRQVLLLDITNVAALEGIEAIKNRYTILFANSLAGGETDKAKTYLERMQVAGVDAAQLQQFAQQLETQQSASAHTGQINADAQSMTSSTTDTSLVETQIDDGLTNASDTVAAEVTSLKSAPEVDTPVLTTLGDFAQEDRQLARQVLSGHMANGVAILTDFIKTHPAAPESVFALAQLYAQQKNSVQLATLLQDNPQLSLARKQFVQAKLAVTNNNFSLALQFLQGVEPEAAWAFEYQRLLAVALQNTRQYSQASDVYQQLLKHQGNNASLWLALAVCEDAQHHNPQALRAFSRSYDLGGHNASVRQYIQQRISVLSN